MSLVRRLWLASSVIALVVGCLGQWSYRRLAPTFTNPTSDRHARAGASGTLFTIKSMRAQLLEC